MKKMRKIQLAVSLLTAMCLFTGCAGGSSKAAQQAQTDEEIFGAAPEESPGVELQTPYMTL